MMDLVGFILGKFQFIYFFKAARFNDVDTTCFQKILEIFLGDFDRFVFYLSCWLVLLMKRVFCSPVGNISILLMFILLFFIFFANNLIDLDPIVLTIFDCCLLICFVIYFLIYCVVCWFH